METRLFPLYEIIDGKEYRITHEPKGLPVDEYVKIQGRSATLRPTISARLQREVDEEWAGAYGADKGMPDLIKEARSSPTRSPSARRCTPTYGSRS